MNQWEYEFNPRHTDYDEDSHVDDAEDEAQFPEFSRFSKARGEPNWAMACAIWCQDTHYPHWEQ